MATGSRAGSVPGLSDPEPMTDLLDDSFSVPARLGVVAEVRDGEFRLHVAARGRRCCATARCGRA